MTGAMSVAEAREIADETIRYWCSRGVTADMVWRSWGYATHQRRWDRVRQRMIREQIPLPRLGRRAT